MEDIYNNRMNPRDPYYYEARYPDRLHPPEESPADEIAFAIAEKLLQKDVNKTLWKFQASLDEKRSAPYFNFGIPTLGLSMYRTIKCKSDWMADGFRMEPEELNEIEDAFEGFVSKVEWEDE